MEKAQNQRYHFYKPRDVICFLNECRLSRQAQSLFSRFLVELFISL